MIYKTNKEYPILHKDASSYYFKYIFEKDGKLYKTYRPDFKIGTEVHRDDVYKNVHAVSYELECRRFIKHRIVYREDMFIWTYKTWSKRVKITHVEEFIWRRKIYTIIT